MNRDSLPASILYKFIDLTILPAATRLGLAPDQLSWLGFGVSAAAGLAFVFTPVFGAILLLLAGLCDVADGYVARRQGTATPAGAFLDSVLDRYGEFFVLTGIWGHLYRSGGNVPEATIIVLAALSGSMLVSYTRARGEGAGMMCSSGLFQRGERVLIMAGAGLLEPFSPGLILPGAMVVIAIGAHFTAINRLRCILRRLKEMGQEEAPGTGAGTKGTKGT